jgi:hypothetical protein
MLQTGGVMQIDEQAWQSYSDSVERAIQNPPMFPLWLLFKLIALDIRAAYFGGRKVREIDLGKPYTITYEEA